RSRARGPVCQPTSDLLGHDPAPPLAIPVGEQPERDLDALPLVLARSGKVLRRQRLGCDDEQRLDRPGELVDRTVGLDQAERTVQERLLSASAREILIGAKGAACEIAISSCLRSSSSARNATATSTRESPATSASKSKRERRRSSERQRSTNCATGGKRKAMCAVEGAGGSTVSVRSAAS